MTRNLLATTVVATALILCACADSSSGPDTPVSPAFETSVTAVTLTPEKLTSGEKAGGINDKGEAVGHGPGGPSCGNGYIPKLWRADGSVVNLPLGGHCGGLAWTITNTGLILGTMHGPAASVLWTPDGNGGYTIQDLGFVNGTIVHVAGGLNEAGEIVGHYGAQVYYRTASTPWTGIAVPAGATQCTVRQGINNSGAIVGSCYVNGGPRTGYFWANRSAAPVVLPRLADNCGLFVHEINDAGVIVGWQDVPRKAVRWTPSAGGGYTVEYLPDGGWGGAAYAVSRDGTASGSLKNKNGGSSPVIWPASGGYQLLPSIGKFRISEALDIATSVAGTPLVGGYQEGQAIRWK